MKFFDRTRIQKLRSRYSVKNPRSRQINTHPCNLCRTEMSKENRVEGEIKGIWYTLCSEKCWEEAKKRNGIKEG